VLDQAATRVPVQFIGLARAFRSRVKAVDVEMDVALVPITAPLRARLKRHPNLRAEMIAGFSRSYRMTIPATYRIGSIEGARHGREFAMRETRLSASWITDDAWDADHREQGLSICRFTLAVQDGRLRQVWTPVVSISLHALARRFERGRDRSSAAVLADMERLASPADEADERVPTADGHWIGDVITAGDGGAGRTLRLRSIRTWLPSDG